MMTPCIEWPWRRDSDGYGRSGGRLAHRIAYEREIGPIPNGLVIDHLCRNRGCVNTDHLEPVTRGENTRRGAPATKTVCVNGHPYDAVNTYIYPDGRRDCRACFRDRTRRYRARVTS